MQLRRIRRVVWDIVAACDLDGDCPALTFLSERLASQRVSVTQLTTRMRHLYPERGPDKGTKSKRLRNGISEWKAGRLRVLWFRDDELRLAVATHGFIKKGRFVPDEEIESAIQIRERYLLDKMHGLNSIAER